MIKRPPTRAERIAQWERLRDMHFAQALAAKMADDEEEFLRHCAMHRACQSRINMFKAADRKAKK